MKVNRKSFGVKLWLYFIVFAAMILGALWLLQTVFLQRFYNEMVIDNVKRAADEITQQRDSPDLQTLVDGLTRQNAFLIFLTDPQGNILFSSDEHSNLYRRQEQHPAESGGGNPYRRGGAPLNWQIGALRNLPQDYDLFLQRLAESAQGEIGYRTESADTYVFGRRLPAIRSASNPLQGKEAILYIGAQLEAVGATVGILRVQLVWVTAASLVIGFILAFFLARRFSRPVAAISTQARRLADGNFATAFEKGFCSELDGLADTLGQTAAQLERAENVRKELLANVSHDLRTPLTMIKGYAEMVRDISWEEQEQREADLAVIVRESDRLTGLVNEILEYSALQSKRQDGQLEPVDISALTRHVIGQFAALCKRDGCTVEARINDGQWVRGNWEQLVRVLFNFIENGVAHCGGDRKIQVAVNDLGTVVRVQVRDYGKGIPQAELPHVWDRYFTAKQRKRDGRVSGLGLAIAKEILLAHGAAFGVESQIGQGSLFWFELEKTAAK